VVGILEATEHLLAAGFAPRRTVIIALGHDEEVGGELGAAALAEHLQTRGVRPFVVLDEGGVVVTGAIPGIDVPVGLVGVAEKGYASVRVVASGPGGHSNTPPKRTSIGVLSSALARLEAASMPARISAPTRMMLERLTPHTSFPVRLVLANLWLFEPVVAWGMSSWPTSARAE
jgi:carboxypeptidase PM20D1